jgi:arylsulfatase A-like enzyme
MELAPYLRRISVIALLLWMACMGVWAGDAPPNIVVILTDDQGYADIGFNPYHPEEVSTPHMDALAREGVFFRQAYTNGNVCSPTRAAFMTGRYQQRAGIYTGGDGGSGLPLEEMIFPQYLKEAGYVSGAFGKWHLGLTLEYNPVARGFGTFYGFMGRGAHDYFDLAGEVEPDRPMYRDLETIKDEGYLTTRLTEEAVAFIRKNRDRPFFLYLAYNAVHYPQQAPQEDIDRYRQRHPELSEDRVILMAMLEHLDRGVGAVVETLKEIGEWENTLFFYLTDNGGAGTMQADNTPLRGRKQDNYEGGIRTPFIVTWPKQFGGGRSLDQPIITMDILPTVLDAVGVDPKPEHPLDGQSLLPLLMGEPVEWERELFWSEGGDTGEWAVRSGDWKLYVEKTEKSLFNLATDPGESIDLSRLYPGKVEALSRRYAAWLEAMKPPKSGRGKWWKPKN